MEKWDEVKFAELMALLAEVYDDGRPPSKLKMEVYFQTLKQFPITEIERGVKGLIYTRTTASFPKPAEIINEIQGVVSNQATMAWLTVLDAVKQVGHYQSVRFADSVIHDVIDAMGGWVKLAMGLEWQEEKWKQKEFERLYEILHKTPRKQITHLPGEFELDNAARGYESPNGIVEIGFEQLRLVG